MNQLSQLIYLSDIASTLKGWMVFFSVIGFIASALLIGFLLFSEDDTTRPALSTTVLVTLATVLTITSTILIPSRETVLAIAASEMGEQVLRTPEARRVSEALLNWIEVQSKPIEE